MMRQTIYAAVSVLLMGVILTVYLVPAHAAPPMLPPCGNDTVGGSGDSGVPDMDVSYDGYYTAVVWAEGDNETGDLRLAYSTILTNSIGWSLQSGQSAGVVRLGQFNAPSIDFDPVLTDTVHLAFKDAGASQGIRYMRCTLDGACDTPVLVEAGADFQNPKVAAAPGGAVVVFDNNNTGQVKYRHIKQDGALDGADVSNSFLINSGKNPDAAYNNNRVHVVYVDTGNFIDYLNLDTSSLNASIAASTALPASSVTGLHSGETGVGAADYPAIAAVNNITNTNNIMAVWDFVYTGGTNQFVLAQNSSANNGTTWGNAAFLLSNRSMGAGPDTDPTTPSSSEINEIWGSLSAGGNPTLNRLHPDVFLYKEGSNIQAHVVWQAIMDNSIFRPGGNSGGRVINHDILYAYTPNLASTRFRGVPMGLADGSESDNPNGRVSGQVSATPVYSVTDLTVEYFAVPSLAAGRDAVVPSLVFLGNSSSYNTTSLNRLQTVYRFRTHTAGKWNVRYNGFELGEDNLIPVPPQSEQDSDCDTIPDSVEIAASPSCTTGTSNDYNEYNCEVTVETDDDINPPATRFEVPDYLDTNSDNDFQNDLVEYRNYINGTGENGSWRVFSTDGGVFLPVVLKSS